MNFILYVFYLFVLGYFYWLSQQLSSKQNFHLREEEKLSLGIKISIVKLKLYQILDCSTKTFKAIYHKFDIFKSRRDILTYLKIYLNIFK